MHFIEKYGSIINSKGLLNREGDKVNFDTAINNILSYTWISITSIIQHWNHWTKKLNESVLDTMSYLKCWNKFGNKLLWSLPHSNRYKITQLSVKKYPYMEYPIAKQFWKFVGIWIISNIILSSKTHIWSHIFDW